MKKYIIIILIIFISFQIYSEEIIIDTEEGEKILIIPDNCKELKKAFIEMATLYIGEEIDHKKSLNKIDKLLEIIQGYKTNEEKYNEVIDLKDDIIDEIDKTTYKSGIIFGCDIDSPNFINQSYQFKIGYRGVILEKFSFDTIINFPPIGIGIIFGFYL